MITSSDLFLSPDLTEDDAREYLASRGFRDAAAADRHLQAMADDVVVRETLGRIAEDLLAALLESPDPDTAVEGLSRYVAARSGRAMFLEYLGEDPRAMHVMAAIFGGSPILSDALVRNPEYFHWLVPQIERTPPDRIDLEEEIAGLLAQAGDRGEALDILKRWSRRETLRIGARDLLRRETASSVTAQIADLAGLVVDCVLALVGRELSQERAGTAPGRFAVVAAGRIGAAGLGYDSPLELLYVAEASGPEAADFCRELASRLTAALREDGDDGALCGVTHLPASGVNDVPVLGSGDLAEVSRWPLPEQLALLSARPLAGDLELAQQAVDGLHHALYSHGLERAAVGKSERAGEIAISDVEALVRLLQLAHGGAHPRVRQSDTLAALTAMAEAGVLEDSMRRELEEAYAFLGAIELRAGLLDANDDARRSDEARAAAASQLGPDFSAGFHARLTACRQAVTRARQAFLDS